MVIASLWSSFGDFDHRDAMDTEKRIHGSVARVFVREIFSGKFSGIGRATHYVYPLPSAGLGLERGSKQ